jgi:predicted ester cyclase
MYSPPTGRRVTIKGITIVKVANNKIVERWAIIDELNLMRQLQSEPRDDSGL